MPNVPNLIAKLSRIFAYLGGGVLVALIVITCVSIVGRLLNDALHAAAVQGVAPSLANWLIAAGVGPLNGDFELVESGMAFAIFAFIPICQLHGAHASVDVFVKITPPALARFMAWASEMVFAAVLVLLAWQLSLGLHDKLRSGETTFLIQFPVWWAYAFSLCGAMVAALVGVVIACYHSRAYLFGGAPLPRPEGDAP